MECYAERSFEELRLAAYRTEQPERPPDGFVGEGFWCALELRQMRKHQVALTLRPDGAGGCAAVLHLRSVFVRDPAAWVSPADAEWSGAVPHGYFEPTIAWERAYMDDESLELASVTSQPPSRRRPHAVMLRGLRLQSICASKAHVRTPTAPSPRGLSHVACIYVMCVVRACAPRLRASRARSRHSCKDARCCDAVRLVTGGAALCCVAPRHRVGRCWRIPSIAGCAGSHACKSGTMAWRRVARVAGRRCCVAGRRRFGWRRRIAGWVDMAVYMAARHAAAARHQLECRFRRAVWARAQRAELRSGSWPWPARPCRGSACRCRHAHELLAVWRADNGDAWAGGGST